MSVQTTIVDVTGQRYQGVRLTFQSTLDHNLSFFNPTTRMFIDFYFLKIPQPSI